MIQIDNNLFYNPIDGSPWNNKNQITQLHNNYLIIVRNKKKINWHHIVWKHFNGPIPPNYVIHHIDHNPLNNLISNLQLMTKEEHNIHHSRSKIIGPDIDYCSRCGISRTIKNKTTKICKTCYKKQLQNNKPKRLCSSCNKLKNIQNETKMLCGCCCIKTAKKND